MSAPSEVYVPSSGDIAAALAQLPVTGGILWLQAGTFDLRDAVVVTKPDVQIAGKPGLTRVVLRSSAASPLFDVRASGFRLRDVSLTANGNKSAAAVRLTSVALYAEMAEIVVTACYRGFHAIGALAGVIRSCRVERAIERAVFLEGASDWTINACTLVGTPGIYADDTSSRLVATANNLFGIHEVSVKAGTGFRLSGNSAVETIRP